MMDSPDQALVAGLLAGLKCLPGRVGGSEENLLEERVVAKIAQCFVLLLSQLYTVLEKV